MNKKGWRIGLILGLIGLLILTGCSTSPQLDQLNNPPSYESWEGIFNEDWDPAELESKVLELAQEYREVNGQAVCWDMAIGLYELLEDNGITCIMGTSKAWTESWGKTSLVLNHVWVIVLGQDLIIPLEYAIPRLPDDSRFEALTTGYFYRNPQALEAEYPELFY